VYDIAEHPRHATGRSDARLVLGSLPFKRLRFCYDVDCDFAGASFAQLAPSTAQALAVCLQRARGLGLRGGGNAYSPLSPTLACLGSHLLTDSHRSQSRIPWWYSTPSERAEMSDTVVCFIHGLKSNVGVWTKLIGLLREDEMFGDDVDYDLFEYDSRIHHFEPRTSIPSYRTIADKLGTHFARLSDTHSSIVFVTHSQGGLVLQTFFADVLADGQARRLAVIKGVLLLACPNDGSTYLLPFRNFLSRIFPQPQESQLRPYNEDISKNHKRVVERIDKAQYITDSTCPISIVALAGENDRIVRTVSAHGHFRSTGVIKGNHRSLVRPKSASASNYLDIRRALLGFSGRSSEALGVQTAHKANAKADGRWFPVPSEHSSDVINDVTQILAAPNIAVVAIVGGPDFGKTSILRRCAESAFAKGKTFVLVDCASNGLDDFLASDAELVLIDHIDRLICDEPLSEAFACFDRRLPEFLRGERRKLVIALDSAWNEQFCKVYQMSPLEVLTAAVPSIPIHKFLLRPYSTDEVAAVCAAEGMDPKQFPSGDLRRAGLLALSRASGSQPVSGSQLRAIHVARWIEAGATDLARSVRRHIWASLGRNILAEGSLSMVGSGDQVIDALGPSMRQMRAEVGGLLRLEGGRIVPDFPALGDVAAAQVIGGAVIQAASVHISTPVRREILNAVCDLYSRDELLEGTMSRLHDRTQPLSVFEGPVLGTLASTISPAGTVAFSECHLSGPDIHTFEPVPPSLIDLVQSSLIETLTNSLDGLIKAIRATPQDATSAYSGGNSYWLAARDWSHFLKLRADAETRILEQLPSSGGWKLEDILDVAVTASTTAVLKIVEGNLNGVLVNRPDPVHWMLADIWDGINDGCWDQLRAPEESFITALLVNRSDLVLRATQCSLQGARFGGSLVSDWSLTHCDLLWADFRSCIGVLEADMTGSNWWSSILPPAVRYAWSRDESGEAFNSWAENPPWINPYWDQGWPRPFQEIR
jgi:hypothetical protein